MNFFNDYWVEIGFVFCFVLMTCFLIKYGSHNKPIEVMEIKINDDLSSLDSFEIKVDGYPDKNNSNKYDITTITRNNITTVTISWVDGNSHNSVVGRTMSEALELLKKHTDVPFESEDMR